VAARAPEQLAKHLARLRAHTRERKELRARQRVEAGTAHKELRARQREEWDALRARQREDRPPDGRSSPENYPKRCAAMRERWRRKREGEKQAATAYATAAAKGLGYAVAERKPKAGIHGPPPGTSSPVRTLPTPPAPAWPLRPRERPPQRPLRPWSGYSAGGSSATISKRGSGGVKTRSPALPSPWWASRTVLSTTGGRTYPSGKGSIARGRCRDG